ncbi:MAG: hypothetical protein JNJ89_19170 [Rubrivivax sp.]|nr:hypothetical protein [Rubrivivax sp.]
MRAHANQAHVRIAPNFAWYPMSPLLCGFAGAAAARHAAAAAGFVRACVRACVRAGGNMKHWIAEHARGGWRWAVAAIAAIAALAIACATLLWSAPLLELDLLINPDALLPQRDQLSGPVGDPAGGPVGETAPARAAPNPGCQ